MLLIRGASLAACLLLALALRVHVFGDPNYRMDESFYLLVGEQLNKGVQLYTGIWDRKPPGLYLIYALAARATNAVLAYQVLAWLSAGLTAWILTKIVAPFAQGKAAMLCAFWYLVSLNLLDGGGGQSPVFYNLPMALAGLLITRTALDRGGFPPSRLIAAMFVAGLALTIKQTAAFEGCALGLYILWERFKDGQKPVDVIVWTGTLALSGAAPLLLAVIWYWNAGALEIFLWAMFGSNGARWDQFVDPAVSTRLVNMLVVVAPPAMFASWSFILGRSSPAFQRYRTLIAVWLIAALGSALVVPTHYYHYLLPALVPLGVAMAYAIERRSIAKLLVSGLIAACVFNGPDLSTEAATMHRGQVDQLVALIRKSDPHPRLLVFQGPIALYKALDADPMGPLVFPPHLYTASEHNVSHLETLDALSRVLAQKPTTVVTLAEQVRESNWDTIALVDKYVTKHCRRVGTGKVSEEGTTVRVFVVWSGCR